MAGQFDRSGREELREQAEALLEQAREGIIKLNFSEAKTEKYLGKLAEDRESVDRLLESKFSYDVQIVKAASRTLNFIRRKAERQGIEL